MAEPELEPGPEPARVEPQALDQRAEVGRAKPMPPEELG
jgi:hypothetical protein